MPKAKQKNSLKTKRQREKKQPKTKRQREKKTVWCHFIVVKNHANSHPHVKCQYCSKEYERAVPIRMQSHLAYKCPTVPIDTKSQFSNQNSNDYMSENEQKFLEILLVEAFSTEANPFFVDNPRVIEFFKRLRSSFKLPSGREMKMQVDKLNNSSRIESSHHEEQETSIESSLQIHQNDYYSYDYAYSTSSYHHETLDPNSLVSPAHFQPNEQNVQFNYNYIDPNSSFYNYGK
ncbi:uncharacterized protein OCT59_001133 [Rhizophagus irregularis]|uniref:BED-type domain-containing protein n=2 Tax=Rhizophagus irregularis TaxID=588596 RepID=A0A015LDI4_RHIIW|nr:hypothetical protein RirG_248810 [Rhizophagus irregularis DAOM 197198w]UZN99868.1 hypothetical protein OCT59_001133 [Rhizophagus irregularis]GBC28834.1 hypothetical protein GLOIN_2v1786327 [Rhizophagus irregularis DAOM 181602=DAOM 197198]CAB4373805.1 unnamed protein product [Rhizophagus irregularis]CAB5362724.1 unnamed protein product [Rhizophagus irregularis]